MIIDSNAFLGHWAFRWLRNNDAAGLLAMMDHFGIDRACVASADAILYRDSHAGNEQLGEETAAHPNRFWCYATLNPMYAGWERDLATCVDWGFRALRLYPYYHEYTLDSLEASRIIGAAREAGLPVSVPMRVIDVRQRHWMDTVRNLDLEELLRTAEAHPNTAFVLTEGLLNMPAGDTLWARLRDVRVYIEISRMTSVLTNNIGVMVSELGASRVLFGTGYPFKTPSAAFLKVEVSDESETVKQQILSGNATALFAMTDA